MYLDVHLKIHMKANTSDGLSLLWVFFLGCIYCLKNWLYFLSQYKEMIKRNSTWIEVKTWRITEGFFQRDINSRDPILFLALQDYFGLPRSVIWINNCMLPLRVFVPQLHQPVWVGSVSRGWPGISQFIPALHCKDQIPTFHYYILDILLIRHFTNFCFVEWSGLKNTLAIKIQLGPILSSMKLKKGEVLLN